MSRDNLMSVTYDYFCKLLYVHDDTLLLAYVPVPKIISAIFFPSRGQINFWLTSKLHLFIYLFFKKGATLATKQTENATDETIPWCLCMSVQ